MSNTSWIEISLVVNGEGAEAVVETLRRYVHQGVSIEQTFPGEAWSDEPYPSGPLIVRAYYGEHEDSDERREQIRQAIGYLHMIYDKIPEPVFSQVNEEDWADAWKKNYHPIRVGKHLLIKPAWADVEIGKDDILIEMDPGMAFGTGTHPTTQMCLMACEWFCRPAVNMLDLGAGSGVLSIAGAKLGCYRVLAREIDELAVRVCQENVDRNGVGEQVIVQHGGLEGLVTSARHFELGMANLTAKIILSLVPEGLQHVIYPYGKFIFSGIIDEQEEEVTEALAGIGLKKIGRRQTDDWVMLITQREAS